MNMVSLKKWAVKTRYFKNAINMYHQRSIKRNGNGFVSSILLK